MELKGRTGSAELTPDFHMQVVAQVLTLVM